MREIKIFDMDDTLLVTPNVTDFAQLDQNGDVMSDHDFEEATLGHNNHKFFDKVKKQFLILFSKEIYLKKVGDFIVLYDHKDESPVPAYFVNHIEEFIKKVEQHKPEKVKDLYGAKRGDIRDMLNWFEEKEGVLVLIEPRGFHSYEETVGSELNQSVLEDYKNCKNKMILTGRDSSLKDHITKRLFEIKVEFPNFGLYCFDKKVYKNIKDFKAKVVSDTIIENQWEVVHMYEDKPHWLSFIQESVEKNHPEVEFIGHYIRNVKDSRSL